MIQGFNLEGQHAISMIGVKLVMGDLPTSSIFNVIDAKMSSKLRSGSHGFMNTGLSLPLSIII